MPSHVDVDTHGSCQTHIGRLAATQNDPLMKPSPDYHPGRSLTREMARLPQSDKSPQGSRRRASKWMRANGANQTVGSLRSSPMCSGDSYDAWHLSGEAASSPGPFFPREKRDKAPRGYTSLVFDSTEVISEATRERHRYLRRCCTGRVTTPAPANWNVLGDCRSYSELVGYTVTRCGTMEGHWCRSLSDRMYGEENVGAQVSKLSSLAPPGRTSEGSALPVEQKIETVPVSALVGLVV